MVTISRIRLFREARLWLRFFRNFVPDASFARGSVVSFS
jgi:hypothetical protein